MDSTGESLAVRLWIIIIAVPFILIACSPSVKEGDRVCEDCIYSPEDITIFHSLLSQLEGSSEASISDLVIMAGKALLETPYVAHTLEVGAEEKLVINLRGVDCTTFAENCLALARTVKGGEASFSSFVKELGFIRYRDGTMSGYPSRLHYFCDWIHNNHEKGAVRDVSSELGGTMFRKEVNFMSTHPESYKRLLENPADIGPISETEADLSGREFYHIPQEGMRTMEDLLNNGDIVGITTDIEGLAIMHVGILIRKNDAMHLMHASSASEKVCISEATLQDYLLNNTKAIGIMVARPL